MEVWKIFGTIDVKDEASQHINNVGKKFKETESTVGGSKIGDTFKKIGGIIASAFAVQKIVDFTKKVIETTASLNAMKSQFEQVFKKDQVKALETINKQSQELGIHSDRLTASWNKFGAQVKGAGMDGSKALSATEKAAKLAADSAAFYDTSLETASASLASFMKGNFEAGDAIGVFTNASQMDVKAKQTLNKSWKDLNEAERQWLLLDTVGKTYEMNGAAGQATREMNSWENVTGNLKATWNSFLAGIGQPVLAAATDAVKWLSDGVKNLSEFVQGFNFESFVGGLQNTGGIAGSLGDTFSILKDIFLAVKDRFTEVIAAVVAKAEEWYMNNKDTVDRLVETFNTSLTYIKDIFNGAVDVIMWLWDTFGKYIFDAIAFYLQLMLDKTNDVLEFIKGVFDVITSIIKGDWEGAWEGIKTMFRAALDFIMRLLVEQLLGNFVRKIGEWGGSIVGKIKGIFSDVTGRFGGLVTGIKDKVKPILDIIVKPFSGAFDGISGWITKIKNALSGMFKTHIKMPKFSFTGSLNPLKWPDQFPKLGINWFSEGAIFTKRTILPGGIGVGDANNGSGDNPEAVLPIDQLGVFIYDAFMKAVKDSGLGNITLDGRLVGKLLTPEISSNLAYEVRR